MSAIKINNDYFNRNPMKLLQLKLIVFRQFGITNENLKKNQKVLDEILLKLEICPPTYHTRNQLLQYLSPEKLVELRTVPMWKKYHSVALALYCGRINYNILQPCSNFAASCYAQALWASLTNEAPQIRICNMLATDLGGQGFREAMANLEPFLPAVWTQQVVDKIKEKIIRHYRNRYKSKRDPYDGELVSTMARISKRYASCYRKVEKYKNRFTNQIRSVRRDKHRLKEYVMGFRQDKPEVISESDVDEEEVTKQEDNSNKKDVPESSSATTSEATTSEPTSSSIPSTLSTSSPSANSSLPNLSLPHTPPLPDSSVACTSNASKTSSEKRQPSNSSPTSMPDLSSKPSESDSCPLVSTPTLPTSRPMPRLVCRQTEPQEAHSEDDGDDEEEEEDDKQESNNEVKEEEESKSDTDSEKSSSQDEVDEHEILKTRLIHRRRRIVVRKYDSSDSDSESETNSIKTEKEDEKKTIVKQEIVENAPAKNCDEVQEPPIEIVNVKMEVKEVNESNKENNNNNSEKPPGNDCEIIVISESDDEAVIFIRSYNKNDEPPTVISDGEIDLSIDLTMMEEREYDGRETRSRKRKQWALRKRHGENKRQKGGKC